MDKNKVKVKNMCVVQFGEADQISIRADDNELASLTDLWKQAGSPNSRRPKDWLHTTGLWPSDWQIQGVADHD
jgi:hypothetical protein